LPTAQTFATHPPLRSFQHGDLLQNIQIAATALALGSLTVSERSWVSESLLPRLNAKHEGLVFFFECVVCGGIAISP